MSTPDSDGDRPAKRLGRKLREARIFAGYRSQTPLVAVAIIYTLIGVAGVVGGAVSGKWWTLVIGVGRRSPLAGGGWSRSSAVAASGQRCELRLSGPVFGAGPAEPPGNSRPARS